MSDAIWRKIKLIGKKTVMQTEEIIQIPEVAELYSTAEIMGKCKPQEWETIESFTIPVLKYFNWPICYRSNDIMLRRNSGSDFDLVFSHDKDVLLAIESKRFSNRLLQTSANNTTKSPANLSLPKQVIQYEKKGWAKIHNYVFDSRFTHIIWTDGVYWIKFEKEVFTEQNESDIENYFKALQSQCSNRFFKRYMLHDKSERDDGNRFSKFTAALDALSSEIGFDVVWRNYINILNPY